MSTRSSRIGGILRRLAPLDSERPREPDGTNTIGRLAPLDFERSLTAQDNLHACGGAAWLTSKESGRG